MSAETIMVPAGLQPGAATTYWLKPPKDGQKTWRPVPVKDHEHDLARREGMVPMFLAFEADMKQGEEREANGESVE